MKKLGKQWAAYPKPGELYWAYYGPRTGQITKMQKYDWVREPSLLVIFTTENNGVLYVYAPRNARYWRSEGKVVLDLLRAGGEDVAEEVEITKWHN